MNISPDEAAQALKEIEASRSLMRSAIRSYRGHLYLWLWGCIWVAMSSLNWAYGQGALTYTNWLSGGGLAATLLITVAQGRQIRCRTDGRFLGVCATLLAFGYLVWPVLLGDLHSYDFRSYKAAFAYFSVLWMQIYMVGGIWFDNYWFWIGLVSTALIVAVLLLVPALFWASTLLIGFVLLGTGFYVRYCWR
jgi:hypothetical protein